MTQKSCVLTLNGGDITDNDADFYGDGVYFYVCEMIVNIALPDYRQNIILDVDSGFGGITAGGLYGFVDDTQSTVIVNVDSINMKDSAYSQILAKANTNGLTTDNLKLSFDINAQKQEYTASISDNGTDNIAVAVMQGSEIIKTIKTGAIEGKPDGYYEAKVPAGRYTIIVTRDELSHNKLSEYVEISDSDIVKDFDIPNVVKNVSVDIGSGAGGVTVSGMNDISKAVQLSLFEAEL